MNLKQKSMKLLKTWYPTLILIGALSMMYMFDYGQAAAYSVAPIYVLSVILLYLDGKTMYVPMVNTIILILAIFYYQSSRVEVFRVSLNIISIMLINGIIWGERYHRLTVYDLVNKQERLERRENLRETLNRIERDTFKLKSVQGYLRGSDPAASNELSQIADDLINLVTVGDGLLQLSDERKVLRGELSKEIN